MAIALQGALRLENPSRRRGAVEGEKEAGGGEANYYNKLITLFPAEALTLYGTGVAVFGRSTVGALVACLALLIILRWIATKPKQGGRADWIAVGVAIVSFMLWTTANDPHWIDDLGLARIDPLELQKWAAFLGAAFVLLAPAVVPPPPEADAP